MGGHGWVPQSELHMTEDQESTYNIWKVLRSPCVIRQRSRSPSLATITAVPESTDILDDHLAEAMREESYDFRNFSMQRRESTRPTAAKAEKPVKPTRRKSRRARGSRFTPKGTRDPKVAEIQLRLRKKLNE